MIVVVAFDMLGGFVVKILSIHVVPEIDVGLLALMVVFAVVGSVDFIAEAVPHSEVDDRQPNDAR